MEHGLYTYVDYVGSVSIFKSNVHVFFITKSHCYRKDIKQ